MLLKDCCSGLDQSPDRVDLGLNWSLTKEFNLTYIKWLQDQKAKLSEILNIVDLNNHIAAYEQSIESGRGVVSASVVLSFV